MNHNMANSNQPSQGTPACSCLLRAVGLLTGDMQQCAEWVKRQIVVIQLLDCILRGIAQVMFVNNPLSGLLIVVGLFLQNPWWGLNGLLGTVGSTVSAILLRQNREAVLAGLHGYNGTLVGMLMAIFSAKGDWYWWLLVPNVFMSMMCPIVSSALSSVANKWDLPILTLPFNILVCLHIAATGASHPYFPQVNIQPKTNLHLNYSTENFDIPQLFLSVPVGVGQVFGCDDPWTAGLILLAVLLCSPTICFHAMLGSAAGMSVGVALAAPPRDIYSGLWGYNSVLSCIAIGGVFYALTWQTHTLALICAIFSAYMFSATSKLMSMLGLPAFTWPFCLSALIFLLLTSENPNICRLPLSAVSYPEKNRCYLRQLKTLEKAGSSHQEEAPLENDRPNVQLEVENESL
ncbi:urea transporter 1-like isoform X2 [Melanotaenia boesemani]|uniref:urea transporter 1-like isoform X1 n=1 Tax=Melanotaenia boesemani TaxID=1250792 RepID=UPI001C03EDD3|nr:urea transporter 1-like isoform X1 [Melanotaenia boesemani]XP_041826582.1 urea transporter 1-like isoform X1 [Melanotaenia boesemani]XP_041826583.1 urea transporter 1-like isoform X1 [Melanotaenia boesemani]XP_041826584.1 urea transporter 1-like isoform X2 [Melanotaenia boesemani]